LFTEPLKAGLKPEIQLEVFPLHINDAKFAEA